MWQTNLRKLYCAVCDNSSTIESVVQRQSNNFRPQFSDEESEGQRMDVDTFVETVRRYTNATEITRRMVAELIDHIDVYHAEKKDGVTTQHITIYYNCIGPFSVPDRRKIPAQEITMGTRKGVAVSYSPKRIT